MPRRSQLALLLVALLAAPLSAQSPAAYTARDAQLDALLEQALLDEQRGDYETAARRYLEADLRLAQLLLDQPDHSPVTEVGPGLDRGVSAYLAERVAALPADAQGVYRLAVDPRARAALRAALAAGDLEALEGLTSRWPQAGCVEEALRTAAELAFERGELGRAQRALRRLEALLPEPERRRRAALQRLLAAVAGADLAGAEDALAAFEAHGGDPGLERQVGGRRTTLRELVSAVPVAPAGRELAPGFDPGGLLRTIPLQRPELPPGLRARARAVQEPLLDPERPLLFLCDAKTVRAVALDPRLRGWAFSFEDEDGEPSRVEEMVLRPALGPGQVLATLHRNRPAEVPPPAPAPKGDAPQAEAPPVKRQPDWCVVALERTTGRLLWDSAAQEPFARWARQAEWLGPPLSYAGSVWVVAVTRETDLRAHLLRLDGSSGRLLSSTFLVSRPGADPLGLSAPQAAPALTPEGLLLVSTGLGAVAAVEPARAELAWVLRYEPCDAGSLSALIHAQRRFRAQTPLADRLPLVVAPLDATEVLALEADGRVRWRAPRQDARWCQSGPGGAVLLAGRRLRALERGDGRVRFVSPDLGGEAIAPPLVLGEELLVSLPHALVRLSLADGRELGRWRYQDDALSPGGPAADAPAVGAGTPVLLSVRELATVSGERLFVWRDQAAARREVEARREGARADLALGRILARRGGEEAQALTLLERAARSRELDWTARFEARAEGWELLARRAEAARAAGDEAGFAAAARRGLALVWGPALEGASDPSEPAGPPQRDLRQRSAGLLHAWAELRSRGGAEGQREAAHAWRALLEAPGGTLVPLGANLVRVDARALARQRLRALWAGSPAALAEAEAQAQEALRSALAAGSEEGLRRLAERFPWSARAADARWELALIHERRGRRREATDELSALLREHPQDPRRPEALARLAAGLASQERTAGARQALEALLAISPEPVVSGQEGAPPLPARVWGEALRQRLLVGVSPAAIAEGRAAADLEPPLTLVLRGPSELAQTGEALLEPGPAALAVAPPDLALLERAGRLRVLRLPGGEELLRLQGIAAPRGARAPLLAGQRLLVPQGERLEAWNVGASAGAVDSAGGRRAWEVTLPVDAPAVGVAPPPLEALVPTGDADGPVLALTSRHELLCLDGRSGATRWRRHPVAAGGGLLVAGQRVIALSASPARAIALALADGSPQWSWPAPGAAPRTRLSGPVLAGEGLVVCIEDGSRVTAIELERGQQRWSVGSDEAWVTELIPSADGAQVVVRTQGAQGNGVRALDTRTGRELWRDEGTGAQLAGQAAPRGPRAAFNLTVLGEGGVYTVRTIGGEQELWSQSLATGQLQWRHQLPRGGPTPPALIETPSALLVPRSGAFGGRTTLSVLARGTGEVVETHTVPGRRLVGAGVVARGGTLLLSTDRGLFGFGHLDREALAEETVRAADALLAAPEARAQVRLARLLWKAGRGEEARRLLEAGILAEGAHEDEVGRMLETLAGLSEASAEDRPLSLDVRYLPRPPEIDGELNDWWRPWSGVELREPRHVLPIQAEDGDTAAWAGREDLSARVYLGWDARYFYFALDVEDSVLRPYDSEAERWRGDCLLMAIDCLGDGGEVVMSDDVLLSLALTLPRKKKDDQQEGEEEDERPQGTYFVRRKEDGSGAVYEAAIPWALFKEHQVALDLDKGPEPGMVFGLDLVLTDDDGERGREGEPETRGARKSLQLTPGVLLHEDKSRLWQGYVPERFARLELLPPGPGE